MIDLENKWNMIIQNKQRKEIHVIFNYHYLKKNIKINMIVKKNNHIDVMLNVLNVKYFVNKIMDMKDLIKMVYIEIKIMLFIQV